MSGLSLKSVSPLHACKKCTRHDYFLETPANASADASPRVQKCVFLRVDLLYQDAPKHGVNRCWHDPCIALATDIHR
jgi:hypothetical protein